MPRTERVELIASLLHATTLELADRVAGLLAVLYAQPVSPVCRIRLHDIGTNNPRAAIGIGTARIELDTDPANSSSTGTSSERPTANGQRPIRVVVPRRHLAARPPLALVSPQVHRPRRHRDETSSGSHFWLSAVVEKWEVPDDVEETR